MITSTRSGCSRRTSSERISSSVVHIGLKYGSCEYRVSLRSLLLVSITLSTNFYRGAEFNLHGRDFAR
jgi:hypothetical protein